MDNSGKLPFAMGRGRNLFTAEDWRKLRLLPWVGMGLMGAVGLLLLVALALDPPSATPFPLALADGPPWQASMQEGSASQNAWSCEDIPTFHWTDPPCELPLLAVGWTGLDVRAAFCPLGALEGPCGQQGFGLYDMEGLVMRLQGYGDGEARQRWVEGRLGERSFPILRWQSGRDDQCGVVFLNVAAVPEEWLPENWRLLEPRARGEIYAPETLPLFQEILWLNGEIFLLGSSGKEHPHVRLERQLFESGRAYRLDFLF